MIMKNYVSDELANKVYHLTKALNQAEKIIESLQQENDSLKKVASKLQSIEENNLLCMAGDTHE